jgi:hypothetical protein
VEGKEEELRAMWEELKGRFAGQGHTQWCLPALIESRGLLGSLPQLWTSPGAFRCAVSCAALLRTERAALGRGRPSRR